MQPGRAPGLPGVYHHLSGQSTMRLCRLTLNAQEYLFPTEKGGPTKKSQGTSGGFKRLLCRGSDNKVKQVDSDIRW
jgi:hypothetical protein